MVDQVSCSAVASRPGASIKAVGRSGKPNAGGARRVCVTPSFTVESVGQRGLRGVEATSTREPAWDADEAVTALYTVHYRSLVRLAALLLRDLATAEEVVQDSFVAMHGKWQRLRDPDRALAYLRQS